MAYYAALVSVVQTLEEINSSDQCSEFFLNKQQIASIYEKWSHLQALLEDYSPEDEAAADCLERRITDAAYQVQRTLDDCLLISELARKRSLLLQNVEKLKEEIDSIVEELMRMEIVKIHGCGDNFSQLKIIDSLRKKRLAELYLCGRIVFEYKTCSHLPELQDYSPEDEATADCLESRITDAAYQVQDSLVSCLLIPQLVTDLPLQHWMKTYCSLPEQESTSCGVVEMPEKKDPQIRKRTEHLYSQLHIIHRLAEKGLDLVQSLEKINSGDQCFKFFLDKQQIACVCQKLSHWKALPYDAFYWLEDEAAVAPLERRITYAAYQVQVTLDDGPISELKREIPRQLQGMGKVEEEVDSIVEELMRMKIKKEVDSIVEELMRMKIKKSNTTEDLRPVTDYPGPKQESTSCGDTMVGFEERLIAIKDQLCGESSKLEIVPLVGMGGIGKTTLARSSFYDELVVERFDCRAWVTVSQNYHVQKAFGDILKFLSLKVPDVGSRADKIFQHLKGRRYLIIMDDVWDKEVWDDMKRAFPDDDNGSRIILTTRLSDVAVYAKKSGSFYEVPFLNEDQSWNLFRHKVFAQEDCPRELEEVGRSIAQSCRGLPLAIVVVAGLLSKVSKARDDWEEVARNVSSTTTENDDNLSKILSLSYNRLPNHLKPCFLYIGGFPEDDLICVSRLIMLWVAEGFLKQDKSKSLEEIGEEYLEDLVNRNLVLVTGKKYNGKFKWCSIHDILRDLCVTRAHKESFFRVVDNDGDNLYIEGTRNIIRRLYIHRTRSQIIEVEELGPHIGSLLCFFRGNQLLSFARGFKPLRVLNAGRVKFRSFPVEVSKLSRLRYLALFGEEDEFLNFIIPPWIVKLENLQTIVLRFSRRDAHLFEIWKMPNLRHVIIWDLLLPSPISFDHILQNLQTLSRVVNFSFSKRVIEMIPNLKKLKVACYLDEPPRVTTVWENFCLDNLFRLRQLETLAIGFQWRMMWVNLPFPENFAFPHNLKRLCLDSCGLPWTAMTVVGSLLHLEKLKLVDGAFVGDEWVPVEGEFLQLKVLKMKRLDLKYWLAESDHFPRLEQLITDSCRELQEFPSGIGYIDTLELIEVFLCSRSAAYSALQIQEEQRDEYDHIFQVRVTDQFKGKFTLENMDELKAMLDDELKERSDELQERSDDEQEAMSSQEKYFPYRKDVRDLP